MPEVSGLLLAAGCSRRFGSNKLLSKLDGKPLILHSLACLRSCDRIIAVIRDNSVRLRQLLQQAGIETLVNPQADRGMGNSLACAVRASLTSDAWCILPADMPFIDPATTSQVVQAMRQGAAIAVPYYQGRHGHPVGFSQSYRDRLLALDGERGARCILAAENQAVVRLQTDDPGIVCDIDTPQDLFDQTTPVRH